MVRQRKIPKKIKKSNLTLDGITHKTKTLYDFHLECKNAKAEGLITDFKIPQKLSTKSRYSTYKPIVDDIEFDSLMEAKYYIHLKYQIRDGIVESFERQVAYELQPRFRKNGKVYRPITYVADFVIKRDNKVYVIDTKGKETVEFKIKKKLFEYKFPDLHLCVIQYYPEEDLWLELDDIRKLVRKKKKLADK